MILNGAIRLLKISHMQASMPPQLVSHCQFFLLTLLMIRHRSLKAQYQEGHNNLLEHELSLLLQELAEEIQGPFTPA
jgi:hypothetical protein